MTPAAARLHRNRLIAAVMACAAAGFLTVLLLIGPLTRAVT